MPQSVIGVMLLPEILCQCRIRDKQLKMKHILMLLATILLVTYFTRDHNYHVSSSPVAFPDEGDKFLSLKAEIGYLRQKLFNSGVNINSVVEHFPPIFVITPTYARPVQQAELVRLSNVFITVPNLHWIVVEDSLSKTHLGRNLNMFILTEICQVTNTISKFIVKTSHIGSMNLFIHIPFMDFQFLTDLNSELFSA